MRMEAIHKPEGDAPCCPSCRGEVQRRPFGEMHAGSYVQDGERVEIRREPRSGFQNPIVLDGITQYFMGGLYRMWPNERYLSKGGGKLHRDVWTDAFGEIPRGCHIHHRDADTLNNDVENLECLPPGDHMGKTWAARKARGDIRSFTDEARAKASEWHKSDEGREWHRRHAVNSKSWTKWKREPRPCLNCGVEFSCLIRATGHQQKFCGHNCKAAHYRMRVAAERNG